MFKLSFGPSISSQYCIVGIVFIFFAKAKCLLVCRWRIGWGRWWSGHWQRLPSSVERTRRRLKRTSCSSLFDSRWGDVTWMWLSCQDLWWRRERICLYRQDEKDWWCGRAHAHAAESLSPQDTCQNSLKSSHSVSVIYLCGMHGGVCIRVIIVRWRLVSESSLLLRAWWRTYTNECLMSSSNWTRGNGCMRCVHDVAFIRTICKSFSFMYA